MIGSKPSCLRNMASAGPATPQPMMITLTIGVRVTRARTVRDYDKGDRFEGRATSPRGIFFSGGWLIRRVNRIGLYINKIRCLGPSIVGSDCLEGLRCNSRFYADNGDEPEVRANNGGTTNAQRIWFICVPLARPTMVTVISCLYGRFSSPGSILVKGDIKTGTVRGQGGFTNCKLAKLSADACQFLFLLVDPAGGLLLRLYLISTLLTWTMPPHHHTCAEKINVPSSSPGAPAVSGI